MNQLCDDPFGVVLSNKWKDAILEGIAAGAPAELAFDPLLISVDLLFTQPKFAEGLAYDVYKLSDNWVLKISADRHPDAISPNFIHKQAESYNFLMNHLGADFVCATYLFSFPFGGRRRGCEVQRYVGGRPLSDITDNELTRNHRLRSNLQSFLRKVLDTYELTGRVPDFWGAGFLKNARYTRNVLVDAQEHPWLIDIGAWPEGFCESANLRARIRVWKMARDLRQTVVWLEQLPTIGSK